MRISTFSDYSLRVLVYVALTGGERVTIDRIADAYGISRNHLMKVVNTLGRLGYIETSRGRGGGLALMRPAEEISLGDVLRATETDTELVECLGTGPSACPLTGVCLLTNVFAEARDAFFAVFDRYTLADAAARPSLLGLRLKIGEQNRQQPVASGN